MLLRKNFPNAEEAVECISRRRARVLPALVAMFVLLQVSLGKVIATTGTLDPERTFSWLLLCFALLVMLAGSGIEGLMHKEWRPYLNDELTQLHRMKTQAFGFWSALAGAGLLMVAGFWITLSTLQVLHAVLTLGIASAALRYAFLERRALKR
jgi:hypothetical protein